MEASEQPKKKSRWRRLATFVAIFALLMVPVARWFIYEIDHQFANLAAAFLIAFSVFLFWLVWISQPKISRVERVIYFFTPAALMLGFISIFEFVGMSGETLPIFRLRKQFRGRAEVVTADPSKADPTAAEDSVQFLQFLGKDRNGVVDEPRFSVDWDKSPPTVLWKHEIGAGWSGFAVYRGLAITMEQDGDSEVMRAYELLTGKPKWEQRVPGSHYNPMGGAGPRATPTVVVQPSGAVVVGQTAMGWVLCADAMTGKLIWKQDLLGIAGISKADSEAGIMWGRSGSPLVVSDQVILPLGKKSTEKDLVGSLISFNLKDGKERWRAGTAQISYASPSLVKLDGVEQIVSVNENSASGHDLEKGTVLWTTKWPSHSNSDACASQAVDLLNNRLLLAKGYAQGSKAIEVTRSMSGEKEAAWEVKTIWESSQVLKTKFTNAVLYDGLLYGLSDGILECADPADGKRVWRRGRFGQGQILVVNGSILVSAEDGRIAIVDRAAGKVIHEMQVLEGVTWNVPCVAGPYLLVRNAEQVACLLSGNTEE